MPKKLLLAEDSLTIRKVFELALSRSGIAITAVENGEDAVRLAGEIFPDLVVADLTLPGKNGFAVAAELRAMEKTENIPVLILSGTMVPLDEARFKASGARGVLFKPFESRELLENIERFLREGTEARESRKPAESPTVDEHWDFSDILDEVETEAGMAEAPVPAAREGLFPGAILPGGPGTPPAFNEFDVSIDEIEGGRRDFSAEPPTPAPAPKVEPVESCLPVDSPPPVTDLSPALDEVEEIEEIEHLEDVMTTPSPALVQSLRGVAGDILVLYSLLGFVLVACRRLSDRALLIGAAALVLFGTPPEKFWPYIIANFEKEPTAFCYAYAQSYQAISYFRLDPPGTVPAPCF